MTADDDREFTPSDAQPQAQVPQSAEVGPAHQPEPAQDSVSDPVLLEVRDALLAARDLPLAEQPAALEAAQAALAARLGDVQNA